MPDLMTALRNAHEAGDTEAATRITAMIKAQQQPSQEASAQSEQVVSPQYQSESEIPIEGEMDLPFQPKPQQPSPTVGEYLTGAGEAAVTMATGATGGALGYVGGVLDQLPREVVTGRYGTPESASRVEQAAIEGAQALTYAPRTEAGQDIVGIIGGALEPLTAVAPQLAAARLGSLKLKPASKAPKLPKIKITDAPFVRNKIALKALGGDIKSAKLVNLTERMSSASKRGFNKMLNIISKGRKGEILERPSDIVGTSSGNRARDIFRINEKAAKSIGAIAKKQGSKPVDITVPKTKFLQSLKDIGVTFKKGEDGWVTPDFSRSKFAGGSQKDMTVLVNDLSKEKIGFHTAHKLKQSIRENLSFDPLGKGKVTGDSATILKKLSSEINDVLRKSSKPYEIANAKYAKTIDMKNMLQKMVGKEVNLFDDVASASALGDKVKRLTSNATSRTVIGKTMTDLDKLLKEFNITYKDNIADLSFAANHLDRIFKIAPPNSLKGIGAEVAAGVAQGEGAGRLALRIAPKMFSKSEQAVYNKNMNVLRELLKESQ